MTDDIRVIFLGTNGWYDTPTGNTLCLLIKTADFNIVLDAGSGFSKLARYIEQDKPSFLFLSHFHFDHITGLHILGIFNFSKGLKIIGSRGIEKILTSIINTPYTVPLNKLPYPVKIMEIEDKNINLPFTVEALPLVHSDFCLGYRIIIDGRIIAFCTDTGYCANAVKLAEGADLLITECAALPGEYNENWPHLNPETAAKIAVEAGSKMLALVHFDAMKYNDIKKRKKATAVSRKIFKNTIYATDGRTVKL